MQSRYAWIIDRDLLAESGGYDSDRGVVGPHDAAEQWLTELQCGSGEFFTMGDDDGTPYYVGRIIGVYDWTEPLDDFGAPNAGCSWISRGWNGKQKDSIVG